MSVCSSEVSVCSSDGACLQHIPEGSLKASPIPWFTQNELQTGIR